uniref:ABC transporter ATP-binding protein n=1 Tax=Marinobacterium profundum TaxID=1714300 RepID=UPI0008353328|nr:ABC transporter ATP-binding protein [Marinobacterium profundum]
MSLSAKTVLQHPAAAVGVEIISLTKQFGEFKALDNVSLKIRPATFHALLGENGAGKSTLVKCVMGYYEPTEGNVLVGNHEYAITNPQQAQSLGLGMVYQHFTVVPHMTVLENMTLASADLPKIIDWSKARRQLVEFMTNMPFDINLDTKAHDLSAGEKQKLEILKQLYLGSKFLILDEPTSVLTPGEADEVLGLIRDMTQRAGLTVLMITHKFREVMSYADEVSVLRQGKYIGGGLVKDLTPDDMAAMMVGSEILQESATREQQHSQEVRLETIRLSALDDTGHQAVRGISLRVKSGEILGIAGVSGNGQKELVEVLAGQRKPAEGEIRVHGKTYRATRKEMRESKVFCLPEEPLKNACVKGMSVAENMAFRTFDTAPQSRGGWWLQPSKIVEKSKELIQQYNVKTSGPDAPIGTLSGGNVQRAVLARELSGDVDVLVVANPVFGLDFAAVSDIRSQIIKARNRGVAVLLVSEDLDEIFELSDRIGVMFHGEIVHETSIDDADLRVIGRHMAGN